MSKIKKSYLLVGLILGVLLLSAIYLSRVHIMNKPQEIEWGVLTSSAVFGRYKDSTKDIYVNSHIVKSPIDENMRTAFYLADGTWLRTLDGSSGPWGRGGTPLGGNSFKQPLPEVLHLTFFDSIDNQFYQLIQPLPKDKIQRLFTTVNKGMGGEQEDSPPKVYDTFDIGFAPKGWIILFAVGPGIREEIGSWQAKKIEGDYATVVGLTRTSDMEYLRANDIRTRDVKTAFEDFKERNAELHKRWMDGSFKVSADWYKMLQTKYPWNLEVTAPDGEWSGEYYAEYVNTERFAILDDRVESDKSRLKAAPVTLVTWVTYKPTGVRYYISINLFPIPKWLIDDYIPYYQDPNLNEYFKNFQALYPQRSLATNDQPAYPYDFANLKVELDADFKIKEIYLQKGKEKRALDGAYEYYLAPTDDRYGKYYPEEGHDYFLTQPKLKDLTDPVFTDRD
ncbi:hypothetical protein ABIC56_001661 [Acinetobacter bereziniae]|uniref:DUF2931 family protein n=1 Tax=Acinetobacter bereziniae TaxID=106648 RepID=UPI002866061C|nr:DUF2931 family protein [Acinetobacter bereziniae]MDR6541146.1 hypothetical protein [Acinetobacter bereziniae]